MASTAPPALSSKRVFFAYSGPRGRYFAAVARGELPQSNAYGYVRFSRKGINVLHSDIEPSGKWPKRAATAVNLVSSRLLGVGFDLLRSLLLLADMRRADLIFTTMDSAGLPVLLLRRLGLLHKPVVYQSVGLVERFRRSDGRRVRRYLLSRLIAQSSLVTAFAKAERDLLVDRFGLPSGKVVWVRSFPVVDQDFFGRIRASDDGFVLSVGRDPNRDFGTLFSAAEQLSHIQFVVVTRGGLVSGLHLPANVTLMIEIPFSQLLDLYSRATMVVLPVKNNVYSAGFVVMGEAMSLGKPVIVSAVDALDGMEELRSGLNCILVKPQDASALRESIENLYNDASLREALGRNAKTLAESLFNVDNYVARMSQIFAELA